MLLQRNSANRVHLYEDIYDEGLAYVIMEAEKSYSVPFPSWELGRHVWKFSLSLKV